MALNADVNRGVRSGSPTRLSKPLDLSALIKDGYGTYELDANPLTDGNDFDRDNTDYEYRKKLFRHTNPQVTILEDDDPDVTPFERIRKKMTNVTADGKVMKEIKTEGTGDVCPPNAHVKIHYQGYIENQDIPFDVSYLRSKIPESYKLGERLLIPGLELGILTMKAGENAWFLIHHDYAYTKMGCGQRIPKESTVLFEVTLHSYSENPDVLMTNLKGKMTFENVVERVEAHLIKGRDHLNQDKHTEVAIRHFKEARNLILDFHIDNDKDSVLANFLVRAYQNLAICYNKTREYKLVCQMAEDAMYIVRPLADKNAKLKFAWGKALNKLNEHEEALKRLKEAQKLEPASKQVAEQLNELEGKMRKYQEAQKKLAQKFFRSDGGEKEKESPVSEDFVQTMTAQLKELKMSDKVRFLNLNPGMTGSEQEAAKAIAKQLGLHCKEDNAFGERIVIRK